MPESKLGDMRVESQDLRNAGLKVTTPRLRILEILEGSGDDSDGWVQRHLSAEEIYKRLLDANLDIGLATVYRVLTQFEAAGLVSRHHFDSGLGVFELNQGAHHDHIVCIDCGRVEEFVDRSIEEKQMAIADRAGFELRDHAMVLYGQCKRANCPDRKSRGNK